MSAHEGDAELIQTRAAEVIGHALIDAGMGTGANAAAKGAARALADAGLLALRLRSITGKPGYVDVGSSPDLPGARLMRFVEPEQMEMAVCVAHGGHCFARTDVTLMSIPPQYPERCRHCPATRIGVEQARMAYTYPDGQP